MFLSCKQTIAALSLMSLAACQNNPSVPPSEISDSDAYQMSRYDVDQDYSPEKILHADSIKDAVPKNEVRSRGGNFSPYDVFGKTYEVMTDEAALNYKAQGGASWYGLKFHGHKTSNGEIYDIYGMTAAHKTLPIPSYVRVTNLKNKRSCIVRVNDRGPFHEGRIIDLSYAAATKLGYIANGTAQVVVEAIDAKAWLAEENLKKMLKQAEKEQATELVQENEQTPQLFLQVGAYSQQAIAQEKYQQLFASMPHPIFLESGIDAFFRLKIGPLQTEDIAQVQLDLATAGYPPAHLIQTVKPPKSKQTSQSTVTSESKL